MNSRDIASREQRLERRLKRYQDIYEEIVELSTELAHYVKSHSEHSYEGPISSENLLIDDEVAELEIEAVLNKLESKEVSYNQLKKHLESRLSRSQDGDLRAEFERTRWQSERYIHHRITPLKNKVSSTYE